MREEYKGEFKQMAIMLPAAEMAAVRRLLAAKKITQMEFIRGAYWLLLAGKYDDITEIVSDYIKEIGRASCRERV